MISLFSLSLSLIFFFPTSLSLSSVETPLPPPKHHHLPRPTATTFSSSDNPSGHKASTQTEPHAITSLQPLQLFLTACHHPSSPCAVSLSQAVRSTCSPLAYTLQPPSSPPIAHRPPPHAHLLPHGSRGTLQLLSPPPPASSSHPHALLLLLPV